jgi:hypothetical protein
MNPDMNDPSLHARDGSEPARPPEPAATTGRTLSVAAYGNTVREIEEDALAKAAPVFEDRKIAVDPDYHIVLAGGVAPPANGRAYCASVVVREVPGD